MKTRFCYLAVILSAMLSTSLSADIINRTIIDFRDDAEEDITGPTAGDVRRSSSDLEIGNENGIEQWVGLRFQNVTIPAGSVINSATVRFTATTTDVGTLTIPILGELSLDPVEFGDTTPLTGRPLTSTSVDWNIDPWFPGDSGANTTTPELGAMVQEIVDQNGWASGNSMVFIFKNDPMDTSERIAYSFDGDPQQAAVLEIDFTTPVPEPGGSIVILISWLGLNLLRRQRPVDRLQTV
jgi:hypothetical protein